METFGLSESLGPGFESQRAHHSKEATMDRCSVCSSELQGRQRKFCSRICKNRYTNYQHQSYASQQARGRERKLKLIAMLGGECIRCGYKRNYGALEFHHTDRLKRFQLDMRSLANLRWDLIIEEVEKVCVAMRELPRRRTQSWFNPYGRSLSTEFRPHVRRKSRISRSILIL